MNNVPPHLIVQVHAHHTLVVLVPLRHEDPIRLPPRRRLERVPARILIRAAAPPVLVGVVVEDDCDAFTCQRRHGRIVDLERRHAAQLWVGGGERRVGRDGGLVDHLVGEGQSDGVDAELEEAVHNVVDGHAVETEHRLVRHLARMVVRPLVDVA